MVSQPIIKKDDEQKEDNFILDAAQMTFMLNIDAAAEQADKAGDYDFFDELVASTDWENLFGEMSWDQAYDRYEIMIGRCTDC
ncbi:MAG: hypothetical protein ACPG7F_10015 [Aggregatilineales bacterium]